VRLLGVSPGMATESIIVRGARVHNLKNIDFEIPHNRLTVVTGVSGSGKSSLAFDTIYAEGQRRYVESLSAYARQFLERIEKPDVDTIDGIAPAVAIRQKNSSRNPRSTVATVTEIYDYLRLLFARVGQTFCLQCGSPVKRDTIDEATNAILALGDGARLTVLFPVRGGAAPPAEQKTEKKRPAKQSSPKTEQLAATIKDRLFQLRKNGFNRLFQNGQIFEFSTPESLLGIDFNQPLFVLVDRIAVSPDVRSRLVDAIETCYREAGEAVVQTVAREGEADASRELRFSQRFECKICRRRYEEPEPRLFSFNNPFGACPRCQGFGNTIDFDLDLVIPDKQRTLAEGAIDPWNKPKYKHLLTDLKRVARQNGIPMDVPWSELSPEQQEKVLEGVRGSFLGIRGFFAYLERKKYKLHVRVFLSRYRGYAICSECAGQRLRVEARHIRIADRNICQVCALTVEQATEFFRQLKLSTYEIGIAGEVLDEIRARLKFLYDVGLEYLSLDRIASTLSGGEAQRIQLATSLGSRLVGALYVLDEPSIGLHSRDTSKLIKILHELRDLGNTVLVVEHDAEIMRASDRILDLGPAAGENGGRVIGAGTYEQIKKISASLTGKYLAHELHIMAPAQRRKPGNERLKLTGARTHNLKNITVSFPLRMLVAVTGVSGSGKSTLVHEVLYRALCMAKRQGDFANGLQAPIDLDRLEGAELINEVVLVDQSPIGRTPRSNPVTYIKVFDAIRELYAGQPQAEKRGYSAGYFSFNVPGGRCEVCQGDGTVTVEMQFLADVELICEECKGTRYKPEVLEVRYKNKSIYEALNLTVKEGLQFFAGIPKITDKLRLLEEVGLGYLRLGQSATTLSGGEAQRMKLAAHLQPRSLSHSNEQMDEDGKRIRKNKKTTNLYIFDEPTTGLHFDDVSKLLAAFRKLIDSGGSIIVIEHNLDVIRSADWVIDLGPEGGARGGKLVAEAPPEVLARNTQSYTGKWLAGILKASGNSHSNGHK
jgi:excinuclease ABC subunit A